MRTAKLWLGVVGALVPIVYCGYLLYYFFDLTGSIEEAINVGLGPTLSGLAIVGPLFLIPLGFMIVRLISGPRSPGTGGRGGSDGPTDDGGGIDADAVVARYLASRPADAIAPGPWTQRARSKGDGAPPERPSFGRRVN